MKAWALWTGGAALLGAVHETAVDRYAQWRTAKMAEIPPPGSGPVENNGSTPPMSVAELRKTVWPASGVVENLDHRRAWNAWLASPPPPPSASSGSDDNKLVPGKYTFTYRSYVNFEETGGIKCRLLSPVAWAGFTARGRGAITLHPDGQTVTNDERFRLLLFRPLSIRWNGKLARGGRRIVWTDSEMTMGGVVTKNPEVSEALRKIPWDVTKVEDGMVALRRGKAGMLAYDRKARLRNN
jgi:hypothetical protein